MCGSFRKTRRFHFGWRARAIFSRSNVRNFTKFYACGLIPKPTTVRTSSRRPVAEILSNDVPPGGDYYLFFRISARIVGTNFIFVIKNPLILPVNRLRIIRFRNYVRHYYRRFKRTRRLLIFERPTYALGPSNLFFSIRSRAYTSPVRTFP